MFLKFDGYKKNFTNTSLIIAKSKKKKKKKKKSFAQAETQTQLYKRRKYTNTNINTNTSTQVHKYTKYTIVQTTNTSTQVHKPQTTNSIPNLQNQKKKKKIPLKPLSLHSPIKFNFTTFTSHSHIVEISSS